MTIPLAISGRLRLEAMPEDDASRAFSFEAKRRAMGPHIEVRWPWDEAYQLRIHRDRLATRAWFVIRHDEDRIGTVAIDIAGDHLRFGEFYILPEHQGRGLGTSVLRHVLRHADRLALPVRLEYLVWNPVGALYARHGFHEIGRSEIHCFMERAPL